MFTTNVVVANEEQQQQEDQEEQEKEEQQAKAMVNTAKFACATVAATVPSSFLPSMAYGQLPHVCVCVCVEALLASLWARLLPPAAACFAVLCCFLMSCHVLYEMSSASAMPKMVGSVPASGVGGYNTATAAAATAAAAARYRVKMKGQTTTTRTKRNAAEEDGNGRGKVRG